MADSVEDELRCMWSNALAVAEGVDDNGRGG